MQFIFNSKKAPKPVEKAGLYMFCWDADQPTLMRGHELNGDLGQKMVTIKTHKREIKPSDNMSVITLTNV